MLAIAESDVYFFRNMKTKVAALQATGPAKRMIRGKTWPQRTETDWQLCGLYRFCALT